MFIGHFAAGFAAKKIAPDISLGTLFLATQLLDLLWPILLLLGIEHVSIDPGNTRFTALNFYDYPISHSLVTSIGWACLAAAGYYFVRKNIRGAMIIAAAVFSHWLFDFVTHRADLPIFPGGETYVGLGLWYSIPGTMFIEVSMYVTGIIFYLQSTKALDTAGRFGLQGLILLLAIIYLGNINAAPPDELAVALGSLSLWFVVAWGYWIDRHRMIRGA